MSIYCAFDYARGFIKNEWHTDWGDRPTWRLAVKQMCFLLSAIIWHHADHLDRHSSYRRHQSMARWLEVGLGGQLFPCGWPQYPENRIQTAMMILDPNKIISELTKVTAYFFIKSWALRQLSSVSVANVKQCFTSSEAVHRPNCRVAFSSFTRLKIFLFNGWWHMVCKHMR